MRTLLRGAQRTAGQHPRPVTSAVFTVRGTWSPAGFLPDGVARLFGIPFTPLLSFLVDRKNLEGRECAGTFIWLVPPQVALGPQDVGTHTHVLQQRLLPHGLHQAFGVHVAQAQDVQRAAIFTKRGDVSVGGW